jgi:hypothetical protein
VICGPQPCATHSDPRRHITQDSLQTHCDSLEFCVCVHECSKIPTIPAEFAQLLMRCAVYSELCAEQRRDSGRSWLANSSTYENFHSLHPVGFDRRTEKTRMTTYQTVNPVAGSTQEVMKVQYTAKTHTSGGRRGGVSSSNDGRLDVKFSAPVVPELVRIRSSCLPLVGQPVSLVRWGLWPTR